MMVSNQTRFFNRWKVQRSSFLVVVILISLTTACSADETPPELSVDSPEPSVVQEQVDRSAAFNIYGSGEDSAEVELSFEGETVTAEVIDGRWRQEFNPGEAGTYEISVVSVDTAGNKSKSKTVVVESPDPPDERAPLTDPDVVVLGLEDGPDVARFDSETGDMEVTDAVFVGDVLVSDPIDGVAPYGIAQVVESVDGMTVKTRPAALTEVIRRYNDRPALIEAAARGRSRFAPADEKVDTDKELGSLRKVEAQVAGSASARKGGATATGSVSVGFSVEPKMYFGADFDIGYRWKRWHPEVYIERLGFGIKPQIDFEAWAKASGTAKYSGEKAIVDNHKFPSFKFSIGPVPVVLTPGLDVRGKLDASASGSAKLEADIALGIDMGIVYSDGKTDAYAEPFAKWQEDEPFSGEASAKFDARLPARAEILLYSTVGPYFRLTPGITGQADADIDELTANVKVTGYITGDIGLRAELFGQTVADIDKEVAKVEFPIFEKDFAVGKAAELAGTWTGSVVQTGGPELPAGQGTFSVSLELPGAPDGDIAGNVSYSIGCSGELRRRVGADSTSLVFDERIISGAESCVEAGTVTLEPLDNALNFTWQGSGEWQQTVVTGLLQR